MRKIRLSGVFFLMILLGAGTAVHAEEGRFDQYPRLKKWAGERLQAREKEAASAYAWNRRLIEVMGQRRSYYVFLPPDYQPTQKYPVIFAFHGGGGNARSILSMTGLLDRVGPRQFILIAPNGTGQDPESEIFLTWNAGNCCGAALDQQVNDAAFIKAVADAVSQEYSVDSKRIFFTGMSNGGMISYRLACELSSMTAGIAPVVGAMNFEPCKAERPIPIIMFNGTEDEHVRYEGGKPLKSIDRKHERIDRPVSYAVKYWVQNNQCSPQPKTERFQDVILERYTGCKDDADVVLYTIVGGKHAWPGGRKGSSRGDEPTQSINATDLLLDFFLNRPAH